MRKFLFWFVQCTWGMLQTLIGAILLLFYSASIINSIDIYGNTTANVVSSKRFNGGISLGAIIILFNGSSEKTIKHEYGHCVQSLILGPLYLFVIGIPSLIWCACFGKYRKKHNVDYYSFYTEKWANKLGGVE